MEKWVSKGREDYITNVYSEVNLYEACAINNKEHNLKDLRECQSMVMALDH